ncbi:hypothetical protein BS50DRAFT_536985 [Corynespora cassiicola Philippines]|uniref:Zn(2)-C6 fungal-type domain-containing protein n=1 Tax=Corynespora cassiicola Philippines TaxID=1448308 RepID=A0A2T2N3F2_CORCC|nr:hypothetical protein BS50DRAFT_536985 [Corynespora cassiicola Philippines]
MPTVDGKPRKLATVAKCTSCRMDKTKCEPEGRAWPQKCDRCVKLKRPCNPGTASKRGQKQSARHSQLRNNATAISTSYENTPTGWGSPSSEEERYNPFNEMMGLQDSSPGSSDSNSYTHIPHPQDRSSSNSTPGDTVFDNWKQYSGTSSHASVPRAFHILPPSPEYDGTQEWEEWKYDQEAASWASKDAEYAQILELDAASEHTACESSQAVIQVAPSAGTSYPPRSPGLLLIEPSNHRLSNRMTFLLDRRMERLWGNYKTFADTKQVSELFSRTVSDFFGIQCRQMARDYAMVWEALYACGAADALMNKRLPSDLRHEYQRTYDIHDSRARNLIMKAIDTFIARSGRGEHPDVLPLYYAAFLLHASGACAKGSGDLTVAMSLFKYLDKFTALFPLKIKVDRMSDNDWSVKMLLANNPKDPGMEIHRFSFILGKARREFDKVEEPAVVR